MKWSEVVKSPLPQAFHVEADVCETVPPVSLKCVSFRAAFTSDGLLQETLLDVMVGCSAEGITQILEVSPSDAPDIETLMVQASFGRFSLALLPDGEGNWKKERLEAFAKAYFKAKDFSGLLFPLSGVLTFFFKRKMGMTAISLLEGELPSVRDFFKETYGEMRLDSPQTQKLIQMVQEAFEGVFGGAKEFDAFLTDTLKQVQNAG